MIAPSSFSARGQFGHFSIPGSSVIISGWPPLFFLLFLAGRHLILRKLQLNITLHPARCIRRQSKVSWWSKKTAGVLSHYFLEQMLHQEAKQSFLMVKKTAGFLSHKSWSSRRRMSTYAFCSLQGWRYHSEGLVTNTKIKLHR